MIRREFAAVRTVVAASVACCCTTALTAQQPAARPPVVAHAFTVTDSSVRQGRFEAIAKSRDTIISSYPRAAREVRFRFSINGLENEFPSGTEHTIYLRPRRGKFLTPLYRFGVPDSAAPPTAQQSTSSESGTALVTFQLDLSKVVNQLRSNESYTPPMGANILKAAPFHVYVLGEPAPLTWDYSALHPGSALEMHDSVGSGIYKVTVPVETEYTRPALADGRAVWARKANIGAFPSVTSSQRLQDAIYRLSLEELTQLVRPDSAFSAGAKWSGVWTRDISLSTILSLAIVAPDAAKRSLMAKVDSAGRIIQDTGTGGSWPISSDRMVWALAAWEIYAETGDREWLRTAYDITRRSAEADLHAVRDPATGLYNGESSFMDWREQSYPRWMQPADIYHSQSLSTNAVHYAALRSLANMARQLGEPGAKWDSTATEIQRGMTTYLWQPEKGWYGEYRYGRDYLSLSPRAEGLGEALASIYGAASNAQRDALMRRAPVTTFGTPSFWPFIPGERFYHNATVWPFVTAYWTWAAAEGNNATAVERGLDDATRTTALFLTNKENTVAATGHYEGTALNSDRQLWSVAGTLAGTYRILLGIRLEPDRMLFRPVVPPRYGGVRRVSGLKYRRATLDVTVRGSGDAVASARLDGRPLAEAAVAATLTGRHVVELTMNGHWKEPSVHEVPARFAPATPHASLEGDTLAWARTGGAVEYAVYRNATKVVRTTDTSVTIRHGDGLSEYQVLAIDSAGDESFLSEPVHLETDSGAQMIKPLGAFDTRYSGYTGTGYTKTARDSNEVVTFQLRIEQSGTYALDFRYANGNGPVNTEDKVGVRTLVTDRDTIGVIVLPQRGSGAWADWGWTNPMRVRLAKGEHTVRLIYTHLDANMNRLENSALLDALRVSRLGTELSAQH